MPEYFLRGEPKPTSPIPSQFLEPWPERLREERSVYHYTAADTLDRKAQSGLRGLNENASEPLSSDTQERLQLDSLLAQVASEMGSSFQRSDCVFLALPEELDTANWKRFGDIKLEVKVDGDQARVYDRRLHSYGVIAFYGTPDGRVWLDRQHPPGTTERQQVEAMLADTIKEDWQTYFRNYLNNSLTLNKFMALPTEEQKRFVTPEVLVSSPIGPENIRLTK